MAGVTPAGKFRDELMVNKGFAQVILLLTLLAGCNLASQRQSARRADPVLPMTMTCGELTDHLNRLTPGLQSWRSIDTTMTVRMSDGMPHRLSGNIACKAPNFFRLTASSVLAHADLGSNSERCWFYVQPGEGVVLTWHHRDSDLLQEFGVGVPRIDPEWLMVVLGVVPLRAEDFDLSHGPAGSSELWLTAVSDDFQGRSLRRVIMVDTITGLVRRHVIYDHDRNPLIRATLKDHKSYQGHLIPQHVRLEFPQTETELTLRFNKIETNCSLNEGLWQIPLKKNVQVVDLGEMLRSRGVPVSRDQAGSLWETENHRTIQQTAGSQAAGSQAEPAFGTAVISQHSGASRTSVPVPDWDAPPEDPFRRIPAGTTASYPDRAPRRIRWWPFR